MSSLIVIDTNVLLRAADPAHALHRVAIDAQAKLRNSGSDPCILDQNLVESRAVATRPLSVNGLGMTQSEANAEIEKLRSLYRLHSDVPAIIVEWQRLVSQYGSQGKQNHDARIVAAMIVHSIPRVLTFNDSDFKRYSEIKVISPTGV